MVGKRKQVQPFNGKIIVGELPGILETATKRLGWRTNCPRKAGKSLEEVIQNIWFGFDIPNRNKVTTATISITPKYRYGATYNWYVGFGY